MAMRAEIKTALVGDDDTDVRLVVNRLGGQWVPSHAIELKGDTAEHINLPPCFRLNEAATVELDKLLAGLKLSTFERELVVQGLVERERVLTHAASRHPRGTQARQVAELAVVALRGVLYRLGHRERERPSEAAMRLSDERRAARDDPRGEADR